MKLELLSPLLIYALPHLPNSRTDPDSALFFPLPLARFVFVSFYLFSVYVLNYFSLDFRPFVPAYSPFARDCLRTSRGSGVESSISHKSQNRRNLHERLELSLYLETHLFRIKC
jgi:hypothetical protein